MDIGSFFMDLGGIRGSFGRMVALYQEKVALF